MLMMAELRQWIKYRLLHENGYTEHNNLSNAFKFWWYASKFRRKTVGLFLL